MRLQPSVVMIILGLWLPCSVAAAADVPAVFAAAVRTVPFVDRIHALGTLRANESVSVTATITETITAIHFDDGDRVRAGQVLAEMTDNEEQALLQEARVTAAEAARQYDRVKSLAASGTASRSQLDQRLRESEAASARLAALESRLADHLVKAPFAGVVGLRNISVGALVEPGDVIATLDDDSVMKLEFPVPALHLGQLVPGLAVEALSAAFPERVFRGTVKSLASRVDPVTRSIQVRAVLPNPERILKPGLLMRVSLLHGQREALMIPESALIAQRDELYVLVVAEGDGKVERRTVRIGTRRPGEVEVLEGLREGERVVTDGAMKVRPGMTVSVQAVDNGQPLTDLLETGSAVSRP